MKKTLVIIISLVVLISAGVGIFIFINNQEEENPPIIVVPSGDISIEDDSLAAKIIVNDVVVENRTDNRIVDCVYPTLKSLNNKVLQNDINTEIAINIQQYIEEMGYIIDEDTPATALYSYICNYEKYTSGKYLSLVISQDYQTGGIRSNKWKDIYNINAETEKIILLNELFDENTNYEEAIIAEITKQAEENKYELMGGNGLKKLSKNQKFYIKDDKLFIYFDPSEAAANVYGELHFEMPFVMNEDGLFELNNNENKI